MQIRTATVNKAWVSQYKLGFYLLAFVIPLFFSSPQIVTGTIVNCFLILASEKLSKKEMMPLVMLPSLGAISHGILFGPQTVFLYYFLPFIWLGNYVLVQVFKSTNKLPQTIRIGLGAGAKFLLLNGMARAYFSLKIVPKLFITSMGYMQLITAILGGIMALGINKYLNYDKRRGITS